MREILDRRTMSPLTDTSNSSVNWPFIHQGAINHRPHFDARFVFGEAVKLELERFAGWFENVQIWSNKSDLLPTAVWATRNPIAVRLVAQRVIIANQAKARETMPWSPRHLVSLADVIRTENEDFFLRFHSVDNKVSLSFTYVRAIKKQKRKYRDISLQKKSLSVFLLLSRRESETWQINNRYNNHKFWKMSSWVCHRLRNRSHTEQIKSVSGRKKSILSDWLRPTRLRLIKGDSKMDR